MAQRHGELFRAMRGELLPRLLEVRRSIDPTFALQPPEAISQQLDMVLDRMQGYLLGQQPESYRKFVNRWMTMRLSSGDPPQNLVHAVVAIGDVVVQVARARLRDNPAQLHDFARAVSHMVFVAARMLVEQLSEEIERRKVQLASVSGAGSAR